MKQREREKTKRTVERRRTSKREDERSRMKSRGSWKPCSSRQGTRQPPSFYSAFYRLFTYNGRGDKWRGAGASMERWVRDGSLLYPGE